MNPNLFFSYLTCFKINMQSIHSLLNEGETENKNFDSGSERVYFAKMQQLESEVKEPNKGKEIGKKNIIFYFVPSFIIYFIIFFI
jgi:hypothetical protein